MKIGILGGTFDPPHAGHLSLARAAKSALELDEVIWMPAYNNPLKQKSKSSPARQRLEMVRLLVESEVGMAVSDIEITRGGQSYAVDTLSELQYIRPADYWFIVGADSLRTIAKWKQPERLLRLCRLAAAVRPPLNATEALLLVPPQLRPAIDLIEMTPLDVSATEIRSLVGRGQSIERWVAKSVIKYIQENKLYRI
jgi:nicotinate-nucleotide adenylyltransferase